jgi:hypothetical protein
MLLPGSLSVPASLCTLLTRRPLHSVASQIAAAVGDA